MSQPDSEHAAKVGAAGGPRRMRGDCLGKNELAEVQSDHGCRGRNPARLQVVWIHGHPTGA
jgi:hypothetical protein